MTTATAQSNGRPKRKRQPKLDETFRGERIDLDPKTARPAYAELEAATAELATAKERMQNAEREVKVLHAGCEDAYVDGELMSTWRFVSTTSFNTTAFRKKYEELYQKFLRKGQTRRFLPADKIQAR